MIIRRMNIPKIFFTMSVFTKMLYIVISNLIHSHSPSNRFFTSLLSISFIDVGLHFGL